MIHGACEVVLHITPSSLMLLVQHASCEQGGKTHRLVLETEGHIAGWEKPETDLQKCEPSHVLMRVISNIIFARSPDTGRQGTTTDTDVPRHQAARCNLILRRFRTELRSRCRHLAHQAHRCYKLSRTCRCIRRGVEETTPLAVLRSQDIVSINSTKRSKPMYSSLCTGQGVIIHNWVSSTVLTLT